MGEQKENEAKVDDTKQRSPLSLERVQAAAAAGTALRSLFVSFDIAAAAAGEEGSAAAAGKPQAEPVHDNSPAAGGDQSEGEIDDEEEEKFRTSRATKKAKKEKKAKTEREKRETRKQNQRDERAQARFEPLKEILAEINAGSAGFVEQDAKIVGAMENVSALANTLSQLLALEKEKAAIQLQREQLQLEKDRVGLGRDNGRGGDVDMNNFAG